jgi:hypothetical protein
MIEQPHDDQLFQRYLLGDLPEDERDRLQERYFADPGLFSRLLQIETDLIDAYDRGELTETERQRFEQRFGNIHGMDQRLKFAGMLGRAADQHSIGGEDDQAARVPHSSVVTTPLSANAWLSSISPSPGSRMLRGSLMAAGALIVLVAFFLVATRSWFWRQPESAEKLATSQTDSAAAQETPKPDMQVAPGVTEKNSIEIPAAAKPTQARQPTTPKLAVASVSVVLHAGLTREGGEATRVVLSDATESVHTQLTVPAELQTGAYSSYHATLQTVAGQEVISRGGLKISRGGGASFVTVTLPAKLVKTRDYVLLLSGQRSDGSLQYLRGYSFSVVRK